MSAHGPFQVQSGDVFPHGVGVVSAVTPMQEWQDNARRDTPRSQARDRDTGLPLWQVDILDYNPEARERTHRLTLVASVQPVPPEPVAGSPLRPVVLEGLSVFGRLQRQPPKRVQENDGRWVDKPAEPKLVYLFRATGLSAPRTRTAGSEQRNA